MEENKQDLVPSFLEQVKQEREALEKIRDENRKIINEMRELKAVEILSGKADAGQTQKKEPEITAQDYSKLALEGKLPGK